MRQQILKGITMLTLVVTVALMTAVASANGQSSTVTATVPFEFKVGDKALPAGDYTVSRTSDSSPALAIRNEDSNRAAIRLTMPIQISKASHKGKLVFHRYGQTYFLSEVWSSGESIGRQLLKSKQERMIESQLAGNNYETIEILAMVR